MWHPLAFGFLEYRMSVFTQIQVRRQRRQESKLDPSIDLSN
jgi:hypothetical protein